MKPVIDEVMETCRQRGEVYGPPHVNMERTAKLWAPFLGMPITGAQVAMCLLLVKVARLSESPAHRDSRLDIGGYLNCYDDCIIHSEKGTGDGEGGKG